MAERVCEKCGGTPRMLTVFPGYWRKECAKCGSTGPFASRPATSEETPGG